MQFDTMIEIYIMQRCRASINGPADPVLAGPVFLKVEMKFHFYKKQVVNKGASMIFGLVRLLILSYYK